MPSFADSVDAATGGLVVNGSGTYAGGAYTDQSVVKSIGCAFQGLGESVLYRVLKAPEKVNGDMPEGRWWAGFFVGVVIAFIVICAFLTLVGIDTGLGGIPIIGRFIGIQNQGFSQHRSHQVANSGPAMRFASSHSDHITNVSQADRAADYAEEVTSSFMNPRESPYFDGVTNRILRMENREKDAVRALGKINQERLRRAAEDTSSTTPLPWGPFWEEWKKTHPLYDGEDPVGEGFQSFEEQLEKLPVY